jgi:hypothetical protein
MPLARSSRELGRVAAEVASRIPACGPFTYNVNDRTFPGQPRGTYALCLEGSAGVLHANWLPSTGPGKRWILVMRLYLPEPDVLDRSWSPPPIPKPDREHWSHQRSPGSR